MIACVGRFCLVVDEIVRQREAVGIQPRPACLQIPVALAHAEVGGGLALAAAAGTDAQVAFERGGGLARDQVDRAAQRVRPVQQRSRALGDADLGEVEGGETAEVDVAVVGDVLRDTVEEHRDLAWVEAAHIHHRLVAAVVREVHAGCDGDGIADGFAIELVELLAGDGGFAAGGLRVAFGLHDHPAEVEGIRLGVGIVFGMGTAEAGQSCEQGKRQCAPAGEAGCVECGHDVGFGKVKEREGARGGHPAVDACVSGAVPTACAPLRCGQASGRGAGRS